VLVSRGVLNMADIGEIGGFKFQYASCFRGIWFNYYILFYVAVVRAVPHASLVGRYLTYSIADGTSQHSSSQRHERSFNYAPGRHGQPCDKQTLRIKESASTSRSARKSSLLALGEENNHPPELLHQDLCFLIESL
jgi:hypothetical protein